MKIYGTLLVTLMLLIQLSTYAQSAQTAAGVVVDTENQPLPGASVIIKDTDRGTLTDFEGNFQISVNRGEILVISYLGFKAQEVVFNGQENLVIRLEEDLTRLEEVVVVGYGEQRKADVTGAISSVTSEDITEQPALTAMQSVQGRATGVQITPSAAPGTAPVVYIRGLGTAFGGRDPLYVVDGILTGNINNINPNDIVKIDVLKDASSLAIYGNRGANGVIIITTRKGKTGKLQVNYDSWVGFRSVLQKVEMADARAYAIYSNEALNDERFSLDQPISTDWFDAITRTGLFHNHNISVSGGSEGVTGFFSAGYFNEEGILKGNDFNRLTLRSNTDFRISDKLKFSQQLSAAITDAIPKPFSAFTNAYKQAPIVPVRYPNGPFEGKFGVSSDEVGSFNNVGNPVRDLFYNDQKIKDLRLQATFSLEYQPWEWITYTGRFGIETAYARQYTFVPNRELFLSGDPTRTLEDYNTEVNPINTLTVRKSDNYRWVFDNFITLKKSFENIHNFTLTLGTTAEELGGEFLQGTRENVPPDSDFFSLNNGDAGTDQTSSLKSTPIRLNSYFARLNYDFSRKYLLTATLRRDGSSQFQEGRRYGNFYSVGAGWVLSQEDFLQESAISNLKLRASYGELGNQNVPLNLIIFNQGLNYAFGPGQDVNQGATIDQVIDPNLSWETTEELDIGLEFGFLDNRLSGELDYYNRLNRDAILPVELPDAFGAAGTTLTPAGKVRNKGVEIALNWSDTIGEDFSYSIGGNVTFNHNELEEVTNPFFAQNEGGSIGNGQITKKVVEGEPLGSFWLLEVTGVDATGNFSYEDLNNDGEIDNDDRQFFGSYQPDTFFGLNISLGYRNWDFNLDGFGNYGNVVYNGKKAQRFGGENIEQSVADNRWTTQNLSDTEPAPNNNVPVSSTYYLESGDFFRLNNITIGYTIPKGENALFSRFRIYATAQNPFISQKFSGFTPELPGDGNPLNNPGIELSAYPSVQSYILGINVSF